MADKWDLLLFIVMTAHVVLAVYTKVEESFNLQAIHDLLQYQQHLEKYDHHEFPGVVPRTFLGALVVAAIAKPFQLALDLLLPKLDFAATKLVHLFLVRIVLGALSCWSLMALRKRIGKHFGVDVGVLFVLLQVSQFHIMFYMSRTLPNTFAFILMNFAFAFFLDRSMRSLIFALAFTAVVVRSEVVLIAVPLMLLALARRYMAFSSAVAWTILAAVLSLALSVVVDSFFWQRWLWPEGEVLFFNTVENKSAEWGVSPWWWYFAVAIPKTLTFSTPFVFVGVLVDSLESKKALELAVPIGVFLSLYSLLPHKELRFIFYAFPVFNMLSALALAKMWRYRPKSSGVLAKLTAFVLALAVVGVIVASAAATLGFAYVSSWNYPGGHALKQLHELKAGAGEVHVHIDVPSAMTGVSRFGETRSDWIYSKTENLSDDDLRRLNYTHLLTARETVAGFRRIGSASGFERVERRGFAVHVITSPQIYVLEKDP